ncbi:alpha/beta hydrolase family protein [Collimonas pratensis]|uniref:alpha/beta hydrolase family protein n=1 Tax=Collimonas pratensis TaxID=279113 RepID=UPI000A747D5A|nr:dienelactone hydrolase [Collimonas pratensis]
MCALLLTIFILFVAPATNASSEQESLHAGIIRFTIPASQSVETLVWYPTQDEEIPWQVGPFQIQASRNATIASGRFPVILMSHGGGITGGSPFVLGELSAYLARQGYIVIAPAHGKTRLLDRPLQVKLAFDAVASDSRFNSHIDTTRLGMLGFSLGGAVTLETAGAFPNMAHVDSYCDTHSGDVMSCQDAPGGNEGASKQNLRVEKTALPSRLSLKAIVLLDPFAIPFQHEELTSVTMPVLIFHPEKSALPAEANALGLSTALPQPPQYQTVPGGHFIFTDVCTDSLRSSAPEICQDPPGVDRAAIHLHIESTIARFFHTYL